MTLARLWSLHFLWLLPLVILALIVQNRQKRSTLAGYADSALLPRLVPLNYPGRGFSKGLLITLSAGLLFVALAGPRWGSHYQEVSQKGVDIVILMDVSASMRVADIQPNRFERARREILDFLRVVQGDRVGLVAFAGAAFIQCPLTLDYAALQMFLDALEPGLIPVPGTDLGAAISAGLSAFDMKTETDKVMLLITDGEDNEKQGLAAALTAAENQVKIFVFGIGDAAGGPVPSDSRTGGFKKDAKGQLILSKLDEATLQEIAVKSGGTYVRSVAGDMDLDTLYFDGVRSRTQAHDLKSGKIKVYEERFAVFIITAFVLLLLEGLIEPSERPPAPTSRGRIFGFRILLLLISFFGVFAAGTAPAAENPDDLYRKGQFAAAEKGYARLDMDHPQELRYRYNRGCAAFQNGDHQGAMAAFASVLKRTEDPALRFNAAFNLGNIAYRQGDVKSAAAFYRQAISYDPTREDARHNLEMALRQLEKKQSQDHSQQTPEPAEKKQEPSDTEKNEEKADDKPAKPPEAAGKPKDKKEKPTTEAQKVDERHRQSPEDKAAVENQPAAEDLSGDLKARQDLPGEQDPNRPPPEHLQGMDQKKAEALLDNIKEDRAKILQYQQRRATGRGAQSGKDW